MSIKSQNDEINRLRFVFPDTVVSLRFPIHATLEDVAHFLGALVPRYGRTLIAVDIKLVLQ